MQRPPFPSISKEIVGLFGISPPFEGLFPTRRKITHVLRTRSPLSFKCIATSEKPFDLHVLTTPPAFILSQDQTLRKEFNILVIL